MLNQDYRLNVCKTLIHQINKDISQTVERVNDCIMRKALKGKKIKLPYLYITHDQLKKIAYKSDNRFGSLRDTVNITLHKYQNAGTYSELFLEDGGFNNIF